MQQEGDTTWLTFFVCMTLAVAVAACIFCSQINTLLTQYKVDLVVEILK